MIFLSFYYAEQEVTAVVIAVKRSNYRLSLSRLAPFQVNTPRQAGVVSREREIVRTASSSALFSARLLPAGCNPCPEAVSRQTQHGTAEPPPLPAPSTGYPPSLVSYPLGALPVGRVCILPRQVGPRSLAPSTALAPLPDDQISCSASPAHTKQTPPVHL